VNRADCVDAAEVITEEIEVAAPAK
jgi:hypothetical protein